MKSDMVRYHWRKFRSQTSDNMDRWKSRGGSEKRKSEAREKAGKSPKTTFVQWFVAAEGRKVGSPKRRVVSWEMKSRTPLCPSQNVQNTPFPEHFWKLRCRKSARRCGAKHISNSKMQKKLTATEHFWMFRCGLAWQAQGIVHLVKSEQKTWRFCRSFKNNL